MNKDKMIKILGAFFIAAGSIQIILSANDTWWSLSGLFHSRSSMKVQDFLFYCTEYLFFFLILPLAILPSGIGMIRIRRWGWLLAVRNHIY